MKIYVDLILLINFLFDLVLLFATSYVLRRNPSVKQIFMGAGAGALSILVLFVPMSSFILFLFKLFLAFLMVIITYGYRDIKYTLNNLFYLYSISFLLGGALYFINMEFVSSQNGLIFSYGKFNINIVYIIILMPIIIWVYIKQIRRLKTNYSNYYHVDIYFKDGTKKEVMGYMDTGNNLYDPYMRRPIILISKKLVDFNYDNENILLVPFNAINTEGLLKCIVIDKVHILGVGVRNNVVLGISENNINIDGIDLILHKTLMEGEVI